MKQLSIHEYLEYWEDYNTFPDKQLYKDTYSDPRNFPWNNIQITIEIPKGSLNKYEIKNGVVVIDRQLPIPCPYPYGFIPGTMEPDGDPTDIFLLSKTPYSPNTSVMGCPIGKYHCLDQGIQDDKLILLPMMTMGIDRNVALKEILYYLQNYKPGFQVIKYEEYSY